MHASKAQATTDNGADTNILSFLPFITLGWGKWVLSNEPPELR